MEQVLADSRKSSNEVAPPADKAIGTDLFDRFMRRRPPTGGIGPILERIRERLPNNTPAETLNLLRNHLVRPEGMFSMGVPAPPPPPFDPRAVVLSDVVSPLLESLRERPLFDVVAEAPFVPSSLTPPLATRRDAAGNTTQDTFSVCRAEKSGDISLNVFFSDGGYLAPFNFDKAPLGDRASDSAWLLAQTPIPALPRAASVTVGVSVEVPHAYPSSNPFDMFVIEGSYSYPPELVFVSASLGIQVMFPTAAGSDAPLTRDIEFFKAAKWRDTKASTIITPASPSYDLTLKGTAHAGATMMYVMVTAAITVERLFVPGTEPWLSTYVWVESRPTVRVTSIRAKGM